VKTRGGLMVAAVVLELLGNFQHNAGYSSH